MRRWLTVAVVTGLAVGLVLVPVPALAQAPDIQRERLAGADRFATAAAISERAFSNGASTVVLARGDAFADALAAAAFAGSVDAPLLLSGSGALPDVTMRELRRLSASQVVILGGPQAVSRSVEARLEDAGLEVERVAGPTRFATAAQLAGRIAPERIGTIDGRRTAFLASGTSFPDALAAGPPAFAGVLPILLTTRDALPAETATALRELNVEQVFILGGEAAVSAQVARQLGVPSSRLHGSDRARTAARIATFAADKLGFTHERVTLARGDDFPDALAAAALAGTRRSPLLLTQSPERLGRGARDHLLSTEGAVKRLTALGATSAVSSSALAEAERAAQGITYTFPIEPASAASYGRAHHDYPATDIFAACGTRVVSPTVGVVDEVSLTDTWDPKVNDGATRGGLSVSIVGDDGVRYYGSHFAKILPGIRAGARVEAGQALGTVGRTGSARPTPCHLHFGISPPCGRGDWQVRRGVIHPWPYLDAWKAGDHRSPAAQVRSWAAANPQACPGS